MWYGRGTGRLNMAVGLSLPTAFHERENPSQSVGGRGCGAVTCPSNPPSSGLGAGARFVKFGDQRSSLRTRWALRGPTRQASPIQCTVRFFAHRRWPARLGGVATAPFCDPLSTPPHPPLALPY